MCGAVPSMVRSVRLYNDCSSSDVRVDMRGRVLADDDKSDRFQNLTVRSLDFSVKLTIFAEESKRYLCFNQKWKLVGSKKFRGAMCQFYEDMMETGYNRYRSVADETRFVGFNRRGRPLRGNQIKNAHLKCLNFLKFDADFSIFEHNARLSGSRVNQSAVDAFLLNNKKLKSRPAKKTTPVRIRHRNHHRNFPRPS